MQWGQSLAITDERVNIPLKMQNITLDKKKTQLNC